MELNTWDDIVHAFNRDAFLSGEWVFRGEHDAEWDPETSLERHTPEGISRSWAENKLLTEFKRRAHFYLSSEFIPDDKNTGNGWCSCSTSERLFGSWTSRALHISLYISRSRTARR